jgi:hypothetical protein
MGIYIVVEDAKVTEWVIADGADEALTKRQTTSGEMFVRLGDGQLFGADVDAESLPWDVRP